MVLRPLQKLGGDSPLMSISTSHSQETKCVQSIKTMLLNYKMRMTFSSKLSSTYQSIHNRIRASFTKKHAHSLSKKDTNSFSMYKLQTIYILEVQINFHSKIQNIHPNIIYVCFVQNANYVYQP